MLTIGHDVPFDVEYSVYDSVTMSLLVGTLKLSLHKTSLRQSTLAKLPLKHINVLLYPTNFCVQRHKPANENIYCLRASSC